MGNSQIFMIIMGIVIVVIAISVGLQYFSEENIKAARQANLSELNYFANRAKAWWNTPLSQGGGGKPLSLTGGGSGNNIDKLGIYIGHDYQANDNTFSTINATYEIQNGGDYSVKFDCINNTYSNGLPINIVFIYNMKTDSIQINTVN